MGSMYSKVEFLVLTNICSRKAMENLGRVGLGSKPGFRSKRSETNSLRWNSAKILFLPHSIQTASPLHRQTD